MTGNAAMGWSRFSELVSRLRASSPLKDNRVFGVEVPLRICPLGAHIDHQAGVVTGMAVDRSVLMAVEPVCGSVVSIESLDFPGVVEVDVSLPPSPPEGHWGDYVRAAVGALQTEYPLGCGFRAVIRGELAGAGLSSSAAILLAYLSGLTRIHEIEVGREELAALVQRAENNYIGVASGLLDQSVMIHADRGRLTVIDCLDSTVRQIDGMERTDPLTVIVAFSGAARTLADSGYNDRVSDCVRAARGLLELGGLPVTDRPRLRDVQPELFDEQGSHLPDHLRRRATHYFGEMARVAAGVEAWGNGDLAAFGELVTASGESSIMNYQGGTPPLIALYELLRDQPGTYGARFSGGGFGGSCIALAAPEACDQIVASVRNRYAAIFPDLAALAAYRICVTAGPMRVFDHEV